LQPATVDVVVLLDVVVVTSDVLLVLVVDGVVLDVELEVVVVASDVLLVLVVDGVVLDVELEVVVVVAPGQRQFESQARNAPPGDPGGHVMLPGGSHCSPGSIVLLPHRFGTVVDVEVVVDVATVELDVLDEDVDVLEDDVEVLEDDVEVLEDEVDDEVVLEDVVVVLPGTTTASIDASQLSMWPLTVENDAWPHDPALVRPLCSLASSLDSQPAKLPGFRRSFASQVSSSPALLPTTFALDDGHFPLPGTSPSSVFTQLVISVWIAAVLPGHPPSALSSALAVFACARATQFGSVGTLLAFAFDAHPIWPAMPLPAAFSFAL
jgi:hypothetical protein